MKRIMKTILKMGMLALISFMALPTVAQTKMMVLSDTHVMSKKLIVKDGTAWQTALSNERKLLDYSQEIFDALMDTVMQRNPQLLLITGDLTKDGELLSHQHVVEGLEKLRQAGIKTYVIPGNHDLGNNNAKVFDGDISYKAEVVDAEMFAQMYAHFGYDEHSLRESTSLTYACEPIKGLVLIGIDSGTNGSLSETTLNWVCQQAQKAKEQGKQVIAMMHHALVPHFVGVEKIVNSAFVKDYEQIRNRLADSGIRVIFTGHFHSSDIAKDYNEDLSEHIYDVSTGSTISYPCDFREVSLNENKSKLTITSGRVTALKNDAQFSETARSRLLASLKKIANARVSNELLADIAAVSLVLHAEANEQNSRDAQNMLTMYNFGKRSLVSNATINGKITQMGLTWDLMDSILNSMLQNISAYGQEGRQNVCDDLNIIIDMPLVNTNNRILGDIDGNGKVDIVDVVTLVNIILGETNIDDIEVADMDSNGIINISDVTILVNALLN